MSSLKGSSLVVLGITLVVLGALLQSGIVEWLLDVIGYVTVLGGLVIGAFGVVKMVLARDGASSDYSV